MASAYGPSYQQQLIYPGRIKSSMILAGSGTGGSAHDNDHSHVTCRPTHITTTTTSSSSATSATYETPLKQHAAQSKSVVCSAASTATSFSGGSGSDIGGISGFEYVSPSGSVGGGGGVGGGVGVGGVGGATGHGGSVGSLSDGPPSSGVSTGVSTPNSEALVDEFRRRNGKYAYRSADVGIAQRFCVLAGLEREGLGPKIILKTMEMLHRCKYEAWDIVLILAMASVQLEDTFSKLSVTDQKERAHVCVLQIYLAHCWLQDETCPIKIWHEHLVRSYCTFPVLQDALFKLFGLQNHIMRIDDNRHVDRTRYLGQYYVPDPDYS
ncbi:unnamed protein product [Vitrella brassicaformis CCMP3155]|uniref:Uncharacterized protein n=2 Tax=Vitrella brassicaformis TaxID=1169539 RepID=A0A0G4GSG7_VITBC|nr:unnamed protein product [Vitrella brassicaformis CCMP3155]|eukprot:CEM33559.1 unnamed protein product [Vitrella brassicaformis CCMP3155]